MEQKVRKEWLEERRKGVGASDAPIVCGLSRFRTPLHVYLEKVGEYESEDSNPKAWGRKLEDVIAQAYSEETGNPVYKPARLIEWSEDVPWMFASLDRLTEVREKGRPLECKAAAFKTEEWGESGTDHVPIDYMAQCQWQLAVTGMGWCELAALFGGQELRTYEIEADEEAQRQMRRMAAEFWQRVQDRRPPPPTWSHPETPDLIKRMERVRSGSRVDLGEDYQGVVLKYQQAGKLISGFEKERDEYRARLVHAMGDAEVGVLPSGLTLRRKKVTRKEHVVKETSYHELRVVSPK